MKFDFSCIVRTITLTFGLLKMQPAIASTFVGNGGNASNLDLKIALGLIEESMKNLSEEDVADLCVCDEEFMYLKSCKILEKLTKNQQEFCQQTLFKNSKMISKMASTTSPIQFVWTDNTIETEKNSDGRERPVHAVSNRNKKTITLNEEKFVELSPTARVSLLVHEFLHFAEFSTENKFPQDHEKLGPFSSTAEAFDTCGAAVQAWAEETDTKGPQSSLTGVSRAYKKHWITLSLSPIQVVATPEHGMVHDGSLGGFSLEYSHNFKIFQPYIQMAYQEKGDEEHRSTSTVGELKVSHDSTQYSLGTMIRFFPFDWPATRWSQFHLLVGLGLQHDSHRYKITDGETTIRSNAQSMGYRLSLGARAPLANNIWVHLAYAYTGTQLDFKELKTKIQSITQFDLGLSYGW